MRNKSLIDDEGNFLIFFNHEKVLIDNLEISYEPI